jgi:hypothetical protein
LLSSQPHELSLINYMGHANWCSGALVKETKRETFALKISHFILLKRCLHKFQDNFTIFSFLNQCLGALFSIFQFILG